MSALIDTPAPNAARRVEDAVAPPPGNPRFPLMDGVRAVAALMVVVYHAGYASAAVAEAEYGVLLVAANVGVTVFFVLSGFLLYRPFVSADVDGTPRIGTVAFACRRGLRILPAYWLALTVLELWPGLNGDLFSGDWWKYYFLLQIYWTDVSLGGLAVGWALCVEVTFYLLLPVYAAVFRRATAGRPRGARLRMELIALSALAAASVAFRAWLLETNPIVINTLPAYFCWFAAGMAAAVIHVGAPGSWRPRVTGRTAGLCWWSALALYVGLCLYHGQPETVAVEQFATLPGIVFHLGALAIAVLIVAPAIWDDEADGWPRRLLRTRAPMLLGLISYGLYLWHQPLQTKLATSVGDWPLGLDMPGLLVASLALTLAVAALSYVLVERPLMRYKPGRSSRPDTVRAP